MISVTVQGKKVQDVIDALIAAATGIGELSEMNASELTIQFSGTESVDDCSVVHDGKRYVKVNREVRSGDFILITNDADMLLRNVTYDVLEPALF